MNGDEDVLERVLIFRKVKLFELSFYFLVTRRDGRVSMVFLLVREITIERAFLLPVKVHRGFIMVIESPERGRAEIL